MIAWMRRLEVTLTSTKLKKSITIGRNQLKHKDDLFIDVHGFKYLSTLKDEFVVSIKNLSLAEVSQIMMGEFYDIEIKCGYVSTAIKTIFKGSVLYISNSIDDRRSNTIVILCGNNIMGKYTQKMMNFTLTGNMNLYAVLNIITKRAGIPGGMVSTQLKKLFDDNAKFAHTNIGSYLDDLVTRNDTLCINGDSTEGQMFSIFDASRSSQRVINLKPEYIVLNQYPQATADGVSLTVLPTVNFMCGDTINIDNSLINYSIKSSSEIGKQYGYQLDEQGCYIIYQLEYSLQNRGSNFSTKILCKSQSLVSQSGRRNNEN